MPDTPEWAEVEYSAIYSSPYVRSQEAAGGEPKVLYREYAATEADARDIAHQRSGQNDRIDPETGEVDTDRAGWEVACVMHVGIYYCEEGEMFPVYNKETRSWEWVTSEGMWIIEVYGDRSLYQ